MEFSICFLKLPHLFLKTFNKDFYSLTEVNPLKEKKISKIRGGGGGLEDNSIHIFDIINITFIHNFRKYF